MKLTLELRLPLPEDPAKRLFVIAIICSVLFHLLLLASLFFVDTRNLTLMAKKGEPLLVDITPDKPEDRAPLGNPARPPGPPESEAPEKAPAPPAPKVAPAPPAPAPKVAPAPPPPKPAPPAAKPAPPAPAPRVAAAPPPPAPKAPPPPAETPAPTPPPPAPTPPREADATREPERPATPAPQPATPAPPAQAAKPGAPAPGQPPSAPADSSNAQTALARPPAPSIFRHPGGGGGLRGGRSGSAGEPIPLDTPDPDYRAYMEKVKQRIYAKWGYPYEAQTRGLQGKLVIEFHIAKDGHLEYIELRQTSGEEILDSFAMNAVKLAQIYPPLPDAMKRDVLPVLAVFVYTMRGPLSVLQSLQ